MKSLNIFVSSLLSASLFFGSSFTNVFAEVKPECEDSSATKTTLHFRDYSFTTIVMPVIDNICADHSCLSILYQDKEVYEGKKYICTVRCSIDVTYSYDASGTVIKFASADEPVLEIIDGPEYLTLVNMSTGVWAGNDELQFPADSIVYSYIGNAQAPADEVMAHWFIPFGIYPTQLKGIWRYYVIMGEGSFVVE